MSSPMTEPLKTYIPQTRHPLIYIYIYNLIILSHNNRDVPTTIISSSSEAFRVTGAKALHCWGLCLGSTRNLHPP